MRDSFELEVWYHRTATCRVLLSLVVQLEDLEIWERVDTRILPEDVLEKYTCSSTCNVDVFFVCV